MQLVCEWCGKAFEAKRSDARTCCSDHRGKLAARKKSQAALGVIEGGQGVVDAPDSERQAELEHWMRGHPSRGRLLDSVETALEKAEKLETPQGQALLVIADRLARNYGDNASGVAALSKELTRLMDSMLLGHEVKSDALDEIAARRRAKAAQA